MSSTLPDVLWHYTSLNGLLGILDSGKLWASDLRFLNNSSENRRMKELLLDSISARAEDEYTAFNSWLDVCKARSHPLEPTCMNGCPEIDTRKP
jgi:hypothetical protein